MTRSCSSHRIVSCHWYLPASSYRLFVSLRKCCFLFVVPSPSASSLCPCPTAASKKKKRHQQFAISFAVIYLYWQRGPEIMPPYRLAISSKLPYINSDLKVCLTIVHLQYSRTHSISSWRVFFMWVFFEVFLLCLLWNNWGCSQTGMQLNNWLLYI